MEVWELIEEIEDLQENGYGEWVFYFCDDDDDCFAVNSIYYDDDGDVCLEASDDEGLTNYTADEILAELKKYDKYDDVYFCENFDEYYCIYDIDDGWYIDTDDDGYDFLCIDCYEYDDEDEDEDDDDADENDKGDGEKKTLTMMIMILPWILS